MQRMLPLALALGAALCMQAAGVAAAPGGGMAGPMSTPPTTSAPQGASGLKEGMTVKDSAGAAVGKITKVGQSGGAPAVLVDVDGKTVVLMGSTLKVSGDSATSSQTKDQIKASPEPRPS